MKCFQSSLYVIELGKVFKSIGFKYDILTVGVRTQIAIWKKVFSNPWNVSSLTDSRCLEHP